MIEHGADVNLRNGSGEYHLYEAVERTLCIKGLFIRSFCFFR
jgi:hypothetical protein